VWRRHGIKRIKEDDEFVYPPSYQFPNPNTFNVLGISSRTTRHIECTRQGNTTSVDFGGSRVQVARQLILERRLHSPVGSAYSRVSTRYDFLASGTSNPICVVFVSPRSMRPCAYSTIRRRLGSVQTGGNGSVLKRR
jgi:hypothetical protein